MASHAAYSRPRLLFSAFSSTTPRAQVPKSAPEPAPTPAPGQNAADGEADAKPHAGRNRRMRIGKILRMISEERHPDKLVSQFITASTASPRFRDNRRVYEVAVSRLASYGRRDAVAALLDSQKPFIEASRSGFAARLVRLYGRASMPSHAAATFLDLPPKHKSVTAFNALLAAYIDSGDFDKLVAAFPEPGLSAALDVIPLMEKCGLTPDEISFNSLLNGFYNNGRFNDAEKVWQMMKERNVEPNTNSYNAKLRGLVAEGRIEDAVAVIEMMQKDGPKPDSVSYNELIRGYCKEGRLDEAKKVYDDLVKNVCAPNKGTFETLVPCFVEAGELDLALSCCHEIFSRKCRVKCSLLQGVVTALVAASRIEEATRIVKLGWKSNYPPRGLKMPALTEKNQDVEAETDCDDSTPYEEGSKEEKQSDNSPVRFSWQILNARLWKILKSGVSWNQESKIH
ncbi:hypothetical protein GQ55_5G132100 [Panicum hallii var. hallii]|uniref:Pentacotripeptide-repeat region of PRORP domain-containing protein n=2 Tax=Panicum hallii var. hallii TaxID=1504633 RepID=A0A2T7DFT1_9POAL|nr:hypothetical protein GQ55_5G132100 [Panicum hallii var. hallii]PUZ54438.1 hypothetical protein GQ55_5G132100 [Panicum hallii var. hallii]